MSKLALQIKELQVEPGSLAIFWLAQAGFVYKTSSGTTVYVDAYLSDCVHRLLGDIEYGFKRIMPAPLDPEREWLDFARGKGVRAEIERDPARAVAGADLVVTDTWVSMHDPQSARERRHNQLRGYQVNEALMARANPDALFMHCLPAHREDEVTSAVMDGPQSVVWDEAENRLHAQKAVMRWCLGV